METCRSLERGRPSVDAAVTTALTTASGRRWLRRTVLPQLPADHAAQLATLLLSYREDFTPWQRDASTRLVVERLPIAELLRHAEWLAGSNAALALWERLAREGMSLVVSTAFRVLRRGSPLAREFVLTVLLADPSSEIVVSPATARALLAVALVDPDDAVRGLAVAAAAQHAPDLLRSRWQSWVEDRSPRARRAAWRVALRFDAQAGEHASRLVATEGVPAPVRSDALWALAQILTTEEIAPLLALVITHTDRELAEAAAELLWTQHRHPLPAQAALASPHPAVRAVGERLLGPRHGSPAAGGRPGMFGHLA